MKLTKLWLVAALTCAWAQCPAAAWAAQAQADMAEPEEHTEQIRLRAGEPPGVNLTADLLYRILASEIAAQRGYFDMASTGFLDLARDTSDPRLAKKAFQAAVIDRNMRRALQASQQWVLLAPDDPEAVASSLALAASNGRTEGMASALWERIDKAEDKDAAIAQAASIIAKLNDKRVALDVLDRTLREPVRNLPVARLALADAAWAANDPQRALDEAAYALRLRPGYEPAAQRMLEYGSRVDPQAAEEQAQSYLAQHPGSSKLALQLANHMVRRGDFDGALGVVHALQRQAPEDFDLLYTEAEINFRAERYESAKGLLNQYIHVQTQRRKTIDDGATDAAADASDARLMLVNIAEKQGDLTEAIAQLERIDDPAVVFQARIHQAVLYGRQGNLAQAQRTLRALKPQDDRERTVVALTLASIYREGGRTEQAIELLAKADQELPDTPQIKYDLGMLYERQGRFDDFERLMRRVIELEPDSANAYNSLGYTFVDQNRQLDEARELLDHALELEPDNPYILDSMGWYYYRVGDLQTALGYLERSYGAMPAPDVAAHLGEVLWKLGRKTEARRLWRDALAQDPDNEVLNKTLKRLQVTL